MTKKKKNGNGNGHKQPKLPKRKDCLSCYGAGKIPLDVYGNNGTWAGVAWEICQVCK